MSGCFPFMKKQKKNTQSKMVDTKHFEKKFTVLSDGNKIPRNGFGTFEAPDRRDERKFITLIKEAIKIGYRHFDTASAYGNEEQLGTAFKEAINEGLVKRQDLFIITKIWNNEKDDVEKALKESLTRLQLDYVDLYLVHFPFGEADLTTGKIKKQVPLHITWKAMENQVKAGRTKSIGISNFNVQMILDLLSYAEIKPVCNQVEVHPYFSQEDFVKFNKNHDIEIVAYFPLAKESAPELLEEPVIKELAKKYNKTPGQIILNWHLSRGYTIIPKTATLSRVKENFESETFELSPEDVQKISNLNKDGRKNDHKVIPIFGSIPLFA